MPSRCAGNRRLAWGKSSAQLKRHFPPVLATLQVVGECRGMSGSPGTLCETSPKFFSISVRETTAFALKLFTSTSHAHPFHSMKVKKVFLMEEPRESLHIRGDIVSKSQCNEGVHTFIPIWSRLMDVFPMINFHVNLFCSNPPNVPQKRARI